MSQVSQIETVAVYPEDGFAVLEDNSGKFLMFKDSDDIIDLGEVVFRNIVQTMTSRNGQVLSVA